MSLRVVIDGEVVPLTVTRTGDTLAATVAETEYRGTVRRRADAWTLDLERGPVAATAVRDGDQVWVALDGEIYRCRYATEERGETGAGAPRSPRVTAPMPGKVLEVLVAAGQAVAAGDALVVLEAMKMETVATADGAGTVVRVHVAPGAMVEPGQTLVELEFA